MDAAIELTRAAGFFLLGVAVAVLLLRSFRKLFERSLVQGSCAVCGRAAYVVRCRRCGQAVAMCHYYALLYPDEPDPAFRRRRRAVEICVGCIPEKARAAVEELLR